MRYLYAGLVALLLVSSTQAANFSTRNFYVTAADEKVAKRTAEDAEKYRKDFAEKWIGKELPPWKYLCSITVTVGKDVAPGGFTNFSLSHDGYMLLTMTVSGTEALVFDNVLPHEVQHTIVYTHFRRPIPRWADEGCCVCNESKAEHQSHDTRIVAYKKGGKLIPWKDLIAMRDYPPERMRLYSQGFSMTSFLVEKKGHDKFFPFIADGLKDGSWDRAVKASYGYDTVADLEKAWLEWFDERIKKAEEKKAAEKKDAEKKAAEKKAAEKKAADKKAEEIKPVEPKDEKKPEAKKAEEWPALEKKPEYRNTSLEAPKPKALKD
jgi:hypothetical protein